MDALYPGGIPSYNPIRGKSGRSFLWIFLGAVASSLPPPSPGPRLWKVATEKFPPSHEALDLHRVRNLLNAVILQSAVLVYLSVKSGWKCQEIFPGKCYFLQFVSPLPACFYMEGSGFEGSLLNVCVCPLLSLCPPAHSHLGKMNPYLLPAFTKLDPASFQILLCDWGYIFFFRQVFHSKTMKILYTCTNHFHGLCSMGSSSFIYHMDQFASVLNIYFRNFLTRFMEK